MANTQASLDKITAWAKRRGFVYPSSTIYGGMANVYDFGPYGATLKDNLRNIWLTQFRDNREDIYVIDSSVILNPAVWEASGHTAGFADVMVEDIVTKKRYRADHLIEEKLEKMSVEDRKQLAIDADHKIFFGQANEELNELAVQSSVSGVVSENDLNPKAAAIEHSKVDGYTPEEMGKLIGLFAEIGKPLKSPDGNPLNEPRSFNQLFETEVGIVTGSKNKAYLRGEIAQGLFMNFKNIIDSFHPKLPFGIGQVGKAFRNEITPGKFTFRTLEFDLMEFEYFFNPELLNWNDLFEVWKAEMQQFSKTIGLKQENLRWRAHEDFERSFYSTRTEDLEYEFPWGFKEMWGIAYRTDYDLKNHQQKSGQDLQYVYPDGKKLLPHVIEPTFGLSRLVTVAIFDAYNEEETKPGETRVVLKFDPKIAPVQVAVFPLLKKEELVRKAELVYANLKSKFRTEFDNAGNIGKMYRRQDEIGTPYCVTIDFDTLESDIVTVRDRDSMQQIKLNINELETWLQDNLELTK